MLTSPDEISQAKRGELLDFTTPVPVALHEYRYLFYRLDVAGAKTLLMTIADPAASWSVTLDTVNEDISPDYKFAIFDNEYYKIEEWDYLAVGTPVSMTNEWYIHAFPDELETATNAVGTLFPATSVDRLLHMLGDNVLDGQFDNSTGYTLSRVRRRYAGTLTDAEAEVLLAASDAPGDTDVLTKSKVIKTTQINGNELVAIESEQTIT